MNFEFDPAKSAANQLKHGIDFVAAQKLWRDSKRLELPGDDEIESRTLLVAGLGGKIWIAVFTMRGANIRLISVRRARDEERQAYEKHQKENHP